MIDNKHISKIIIALMTISVCIILAAVLFSDKLENILGDSSVKMEYESELFDTSEIITIDIQMDDEDWNEMLSNAISEEYYVCDVVINGKKIKNVAIRPKGNTSLSSIAMDPDTDRYSFKLEFDHYVEGQTCYGLDKLLLNNNYADSTNMKEAIIYDMFQYIGADASLYNYAKVNVNGEYWGVYLALEGIEDSFMVRNYGTSNGKLYKPESMGIGGGDDNKDRNDNDRDNKKPEGGMPDFGGDFNPEDFKNFGGGDFNPEDFKNFEGGDFNPGNMPGFGDGNTSTYDAQSEATPEAGQDNLENSHQDRKDAGGFGGFSMGSGGANLNYSDDDLDSYSTIWDGAVTDTSKKDRRRVVTAIKNINEGTDIEKYLDVDNILKFMAVHTFSVNMDSLSGTMAHNYYLYENDGMLNMIPWDYNLSFGGMGMGAGSSSSSSMINDAIDSPFQSTQFFDALLENEEYRNKYHEYLRILVEEYVGGGKFDETYQRIRSQIDELVATDPTAFYTEDEYKAGVEMLCKTIELRAKSIDGQLKGEIPSTDDGQKEDSSALIDSSEIDTSVMGQMNMGGNHDDRERQTPEDTSIDAEIEASDDLNSTTDAGINESDSEEKSNHPEPPSGFGGFEGFGTQTDYSSGIMTIVICLVVMLFALTGLKLYKRRK